MRLRSLRVRFRLASAALFACLTVMVPSARAENNPWKDPAQFADEVFRLTNDARAANGLPAFRRDARLDRAAAAFSEYMGKAGFFEHVGPDGVDVPQRVTAQGYRGITWGENIAWGYRTPREVVDGWLASAGHRANLLSPRFHDLGVGIAIVGGRTYMTQDFGTLPASAYRLAEEAATTGGKAPEKAAPMTRGAKEAAGDRRPSARHAAGGKS
jgi:uncharacterized protein YkwD